MLRFHRFSIPGLLAAICPVAFYADDPAGGGNTPPATSPATPAATPPAIDVQAEVAKALEAERAAFSAKLKTVTGFDSFDALAEAEAKRKGEEGKLLDQRTAELTAANLRIAGMQVHSALSDAAVAAGAVDPATVVALLASQGKVEGEAVTVGGKSAKDAVEALLKDKPFLAKPTGHAGGGTPQSSGAGGEANPWHPDTFNLTEQGRIARADPAKADRMKAEAETAKKAKK